MILVFDFFIQSLINPSKVNQAFKSRVSKIIIEIIYKVDDFMEELLWCSINVLYCTVFKICV